MTYTVESVRKYMSKMDNGFFTDAQVQRMIDKVLAGVFNHDTTEYFWTYAGSETVKEDCMLQGCGFPILKRYKRRGTAERYSRDGAIVKIDATEYAIHKYLCGSAYELVAKKLEEVRGYAV